MKAMNKRLAAARLANGFGKEVLFCPDEDQEQDFAAVWARAEARGEQLMVMHWPGLNDEAFAAMMAARPEVAR